MTCKVFTQTDTLQKKTKYIFLTEEQARLNIKELILYDGLKTEYAVQNQRISALSLNVSTLQFVLSKKDTIISYKDSIIDRQNKIIQNLKSPIYNKKFINFNFYGGVQSWNFNFNNLDFYIKGSLEVKNISIGTKFNFLPVKIYNIPNFYYSVYLEYKIF